MFEKILDFLGIAHDVAENTRTTTSNVKSNKPAKRNYTFDDGLGFTKEDFERAKKESKRKSKSNKTKTLTKDDDNIK